MKGLGVRNMTVNGFLICKKYNKEYVYYSGCKMGASFGGIYQAKLYKSKVNAQKTINNHVWKDCEIISATLEIINGE